MTFINRMSKSVNKKHVNYTNHTLELEDHKDDYYYGLSKKRNPPTQTIIIVLSRDCREALKIEAEHERSGKLRKPRGDCGDMLEILFLEGTR